MPFTVSHVAAALPLRRLNLIWSAFVVGSVAPDFPYVLGTTKYRILGHGFPGVLCFTFPASLGVLWLFHVAIKRPVVRLLPAGFEHRLHGQLGAFRFGGPARFAAILFSLTLGLATHLAWDAFTHPFTWPWRRWVWLRSWIHLPLAGDTEIDVVLQYASTLIGLVAIAAWIALWYHRTAPPAKPLRLQCKGLYGILVLAMLAVAAAVGLVRAVVLTGTPRNIDDADKFLALLGVTSLAVVFWELLVYSLVMTARGRQLR
jgi:membrane-bound metal-dependent hydrolase YbcI (DUF457 family)